MDQTIYRTDGQSVPPTVQPIDKEQLRKLTSILEKYKSGKAMTESRIIASENWWKLRNSRGETGLDTLAEAGFKSASAWLHNVIASKHADAMANIPEANIRARERSDTQEAKTLKSIIPCVLDFNDFEDTYNLWQWAKMRSGTAALKVVWDKNKLNGLGDISIINVNLLNLFWEPGVTDIQNSRYFFHVELCDKDILEETYPQLKGKLTSANMIVSRYQYDDAIDTSDKACVIECYYHKQVNGRRVLHYVKYVGDEVLYATENDTAPPTVQTIDPMSGQTVEMPSGESIAVRGMYDHGMYPYVFDTLYPIEGSPCGYGFVDLCKNPQTTIDLLNTAFIKNAMLGSTPRYFQRADGSINEQEFLDLTRPIVHVNGNLGEDSIRQIAFNGLDSIYVTLRDQTIQELRETSGNTETSTGSTSAGVTAASAIAALQEASGKGSRDSTANSYRAYEDIVYLVIELIRQFYDMPRQFRIAGTFGQDSYIYYTNANLRPQPQGEAFGQSLGYRLPEFDIKASAQKKSAYTRVSQNELALELYNRGFFNPQMTDQALCAIQMMDFDGQEDVAQMIARNGTIYQRCTEYMQLALRLAAESHPEMVDAISRDIMQTMGVQPTAQSGGEIELDKSDESGITRNARERSRAASSPDGRTEDET